MARKLERPDNASLGTAKAIEAIIARLVDLEPESFEWEAPWSHGTIQHSERVFAVAQYAIRFPGDLCEIGCMIGTMTARLGAIAKAHDRRVIAIDPWQKGAQNCEGWEYEAFLDNTEVVKDAIEVIRATSQSREAARRVQPRALCFGFVDGSHEYPDCYSDIMLLAHAPIVCVDDVLWNGVVRQAFAEAAGRLGKRIIAHEMAKEGYLV